MAFLGSFNAKCADALNWLSATRKRSIALLVVLCCCLYIPGQASLPVTDRDEARFAQATKQMLETGDFIDIRFQDVPRYKKPVGIHWLQSLSVAAFGNEARNNIWAYRIPSLIAMIAAALLTWWAARPIFGRETALLAAILLASAITVSFEARIAKSDAVLFALIILAQGAFARIFLLYKKRSEMVGVAATFWVAMGAAILVKGPVAPAVLALTGAALAIMHPDRRWLRNLHAAWGVPMMLAITLPWFIAIGVISEGAFFTGSAGKDFAGKLVSGAEAHGAPPGFYLITFWWSFWPGALIVTGGAALWLWRRRVNRRALWLLSSIIPYWFIIELVPTKLPHYALPVYPAIAMAAAWALREGLAQIPSRTYKQGAALWLFVVTLQIVAFGVAIWWFKAYWSIALALLGACIGTLAITAAIAAWRRESYAAITLGVAAAGMLNVGAFGGVLPALKPIFPSQRSADALAPFLKCGDGPVAFAGHNEPSAVFLHGTDTKLISYENAARALLDGSAAYAFVDAKRIARFEAVFQEKGQAVPTRLACAEGIDVNGGKLLALGLYSLKPLTAFKSCVPNPEYKCPSYTIEWRGKPVFKAPAR
ncbi:MAG: glycosyltransferase family 39 protein [Hyphomicrobiales bacterium]|nr:glycosyltransferase family 39 protein [Hyphomicrobiales bacterium]